jgi:cytochrome c biogenesis protein CcmG/thiol:disulfide interchange protein DsbE
VSLLWLALWSLASAAPEMIPEQDVDVVGRTAPTMQLRTLDGADFDLQALRGKPVVLSFWASWCTPCRQELPALDKLAAERTDIHVYAVNVDKQRHLAQKFLEKVPLDMPVVWDNESVAMGQYDVVSMPTMFVIDANGTVKWRKSGYSTKKGLAEVETALDGLR